MNTNPYQYFIRLALFSLIITTPTLAAITSDLVLSTDSTCGELTTTSSILPSNTLAIYNEWDYIFFGGENKISVFAKSDLKN